MSGHPSHAFPVLGKVPKGTTVPWAWLAQFEAQAIRVHDQSLKMLAERGGLDFSEIWGVINGKNVFAMHRLDPAACEREVRAAVSAWEAAQSVPPTAKSE
jgi:hypothetical protein